MATGHVKSSHQAAQYLQALESERPGLETEVLDGGDTEDDVSCCTWRLHVLAEHV